MKCVIDVTFMFQQRCSFVLRKIAFVDFQSELFCFENNDVQCLAFMILLQQFLRIRQIIFKYSIIFAERKVLSANEIIKFFSFSFVFKNVFYFSLLVFIHKDYFILRDDA